MRKFLFKIIVLISIKIRWAYFHVSPRYIKFCIKDNGKDTQWYFQDLKTGEILCNYEWKD